MKKTITIATLSLLSLLSPTAANAQQQLQNTTDKKANKAYNKDNYLCTIITKIDNNNAIPVYTYYCLNSDGTYIIPNAQQLAKYNTFITAEGYCLKHNGECGFVVEKKHNDNKTTYLHYHLKTDGTYTVFETKERYKILEAEPITPDTTTVSPSNWRPREITPEDLARYKEEAKNLDWTFSEPITLMPPVEDTIIVESCKNTKEHTQKYIETKNKYKNHHTNYQKSY